MNNNNFYTKIKDLIKDHSVPSDHDAIWNNVFLEMQKKKKRRRFLIWFVFPVLLGLLSTPFWLFNNKKTSPASFNDKIELKTASEPMAANLIKNKVKQQSTNSPIQSNNSNSVVINNNKSATTINNNITEKKIVKKTYLDTKPEQELISSSVLDDSFTDRASNISKQETKTDFILSNLSNQDIYRIISDDIIEIKPDKYEQQINPIAIKNGPWTLGFFIAPGLISNSFSTSNDANSSLARSRQTSEQPVEELSIGSDLSYHLNDHWFLTSGIEYNRLIDKFEASYSDTTVKVEKEVLIGTVINSRSNQKENFYGDAARTTIRKIYQKTYNRYHFVSIPLIINYRNSFNQIHFGAHAGVGIQSMFAVSGKAFNDNKVVSLADYSRNHQKIYNADFQLNAIFGVDLSYQATTNWKVYISPEFISSIDGITDSQSDLKHQVNRYRIKLGMRYSL